MDDVRWTGPWEPLARSWVATVTGCRTTKTSAEAQGESSVFTKPASSADAPRKRNARLLSVFSTVAPGPDRCARGNRRRKNSTRSDTARIARLARWYSSGVISAVTTATARTGGQASAGRLRRHITAKYEVP